jgi:hypothetical protein
MSKLNLKSYGYATLDGEGPFEVMWEERNNFIKKLLGVQTKFKFTTYGLTKGNWKTSMNYYDADLFNWVDDKGNVINDIRILNKIEEVLTRILLDDIIHGH